MLYGIVDIGSNTIRLKIYEYKNNKIKSVFSKKKTAGLIAYRDDGKLNDEGINILSSILNKFNKIMDLLNINEIEKIDILFYNSCSAYNTNF